MGAVGARVEALLSRGGDAPWPDAEQLAAWADAAGDDASAAFQACQRADHVLALAAAYGAGPAGALPVAAAWAREAGQLMPRRDARIVRIAFAAEQGGARSRAKLLEDAKGLLRDAERMLPNEAKPPPPAEALAHRAALEIQRTAAFLALALVTFEAPGDCFANLAHVAQQAATAFAAHRLAGGDGAAAAVTIAAGDATGGAKALMAAVGAVVDAATLEELIRLAAPLRDALGPSFERAVAGESA